MNTILVITEPAHAEALILTALKLTAHRAERISCYPLVGDGDEGKTRAIESAIDRAIAVAEQKFERITIERAVLGMDDPFESLLVEVEIRDEPTIIIAVDGRRPADDPTLVLADRLLRAGLCETVVTDPGSGEGAIDRIVVPMGEAGGASALAAARRLIVPGHRIVALMVREPFGVDAAEIGERELALELEEAKVEADAPVDRRVVLSKDHAEGVLSVVGSSDLVMIGATSTQPLLDLRAVSTAVAPAATAARIAIVRPARDRSNIAGSLTKRFARWMPALDPRHRVDLFERLHAGAKWSPDFMAMIALSSALASLGLLQSSGAVVIGAMLVAPLMTPLIGAGLALVQGNLRLFSRSIRAMLLGVLVAFLVSIVVGLLVDQPQLSLEIQARGHPTTLDLAVALFSGMAAAYALSRPNVIAAMAGVAIAAALVPPLCSVGLALTAGRLHIAAGAALLLGTNLVTIILGAALVFRVLGVQGSRVGLGPAYWARFSLIGLTLFTVLLVGFLFDKYLEQISIGQTRPIAYPVSERVADAVYSMMEAEPDVEVVLLRQPGRDGAPVDVSIVLASPHPLSEGFIDLLKSNVREARRDPNLRVGVVVLQSGLRIENEPAPVDPENRALEGPPGPMGEPVDLRPPDDG